jgi:hypothetical protein
VTKGALLPRVEPPEPAGTWPTGEGQSPAARPMWKNRPNDLPTPRSRRQGLEVDTGSGVRRMPTGGSLSELLEPIEPHLQRLATPDALRQMRAVTHEFPLALTSTIGFEFRTTDVPAAVDLLIPVAVPGRHVLAGEGSACLPHYFYNLPIWRRLSRLARIWCNPSSPLNQKLLTIWLEFDQPSLATGTAPTPFVFLSLSDVGRLVADAELSWCLDEALPTVLGHQLAPSVDALLRTCVDGLPAGAGTADIGLAVNRRPTVIRLNIKGLHLSGIASYARHIGWPGAAHDYDRLEDLISGLAPLIPATKLCIDLGDGVGPRLGLECPISLEQRLAAGGWSTLLSFVQQRGLFGHEMQSALLSYVGVSYPRAHGPWPRALRSASGLLDGRYQPVIVRDLSHVKISVVAGGRDDAKAYGYAGYAWRKRVYQRT